MRTQPPTNRCLLRAQSILPFHLASTCETSAICCCTAAYAWPPNKHGQPVADEHSFGTLAEHCHADVGGYIPSLVASAMTQMVVTKQGSFKSVAFMYMWCQDSHHDVVSTLPPVTTGKPTQVMPLCPQQGRSGMEVSSGKSIQRIKTKWSMSKTIKLPRSKYVAPARLLTSSVASSQECHACRGAH